MLLPDRRQRLIYLCLAGMEISWIAPFVALLLYQQGLGLSPMALYIRLVGVLLALMLLIEFLNWLEVDSPRYELTVSGLIVFTGVLLVRFWLYVDAPFFDLGWLRNILDALFNIHKGLRPELVLILTSLLLWQRAASATSRSLDFFSVGVSFRLGILLLILGAGLFNSLSGQNVTSLLWLYLGLGLTAVGLARMQEKATLASSAGRLLPLQRLAQLLAAVALTVGGAAWLSFLCTPARIRTALGWLEPLWSVLGLLLTPLELVLLWLSQIILGSLDWVVRRLLRSLTSEVLEALFEKLTSWAAVAQQARRPGGLMLPPQLLTGLRYAGVLLSILLIIGFVLLYLGKVRSRRQTEEPEDEGQEGITFGGGTLGRGAEWLRDMAGLVRRFGLSRQLLAAVSVQNIYANLCRLARQRGYPRHPAQPPDDYLPVLAQAFGGQEEALGRITAAYMRVHYGDQLVGTSEVRQLRNDYDQVRAAKVRDQP